MKITVEHAPVEENEIILRCERLDAEMLQVLALLEARNQRLYAWDADRSTIFLSPGEVLYAESVEEKAFLYCPQAVYQTPLTLAELEARCGPLGYQRVSRTMVVNLHRIRSLKSCAAARIAATMENGERIMVSRHYAPLLRERLGL